MPKKLSKAKQVVVSACILIICLHSSLREWDKDSKNTSPTSQQKTVTKESKHGLEQDELNGESIKASMMECRFKS